MIRTLSARLLLTSIFTLSLSTPSFAYHATQGITLAQVTDDVSYLASDELQGRGNFSAEIGKAADYIAKRFADNGLKNASGISANNFLQHYNIIKITPTKLNLSLNGKEIAADQLAIASTLEQLSWNIDNKASIAKAKFTLHTVSKDDDMRATLSKLNHQGGQHLVLLNSAHADLFKRYQSYFGRGLTKLANATSDNGGAIVIALTDFTASQINTLSLTSVNTKSNHELTNVVAVLPGKSKPEEIVLYSAHYDHLGVKNSQDNSDNIYNGADDDASGTAAVINLAQHFAKQGKNERTLMFAAFSAEEIGGFGSKYFSKQLVPSKITAMINIEMIGKPSKFGAGSIWMTGMERSSLGEQLNNALAKTGEQIHQDPYPEQGLFYRSDNATLARLGVPAHSFSSTQLDKDQHYHKASDDVASLDLKSLHKVIQALATATQPLVDGTITPSRIDVNKVKGKGLIY